MNIRDEDGSVVLLLHVKSQVSMIKTCYLVLV
jgi:hypothetical protein